MAPHSKKGTTEQDLWPFDFEKETLHTRSLEDEIEEAKKLQESIEFWERVDAARKQKATC